MVNALTKDDLRGVIPPLTTPFTEDEELDLANFRREVNRSSDIRRRGRGTS